MLEILGWNVLSNEVRLEHPVRIGSSTVYVDYALMLEDKPVVLLEAKAFDVMLSDEHSSQIISYGRIEDVQWVSLTNGKILKVFNTREGKTEKECLIVDVDLEKLPQQASDLYLISRESILTGEIEEDAKRLATSKKTLLRIKQRQQELAEEFKRALLKIAGTEVENRLEFLSSQLVK